MWIRSRTSHAFPCCLFFFLSSSHFKNKHCCSNIMWPPLVFNLSIYARLPLIFWQSLIQHYNWSDVGGIKRVPCSLICIFMIWTAAELSVVWLMYCMPLNLSMNVLDLYCVFCVYYRAVHVINSNSLKRR